MPKARLLPALTTLAIIALVGLMASTAHATTQTAYCFTAPAGWPTGHFDWFQGRYTLTDSTVWRTPTIARGFYYYTPTDPPTYDTSRAYPRKNGYCVFNIPGFNWTGDLPACTLFYYQSAHNGTPDLLVNAWVPYGIFTNPPGPGFTDSCFWRIWRSADTVAWDSTHAIDGNWYKVQLSYWGTCAIADSGSYHYAAGGSALFYTGWKYPTYAVSHGQTGWYTDVSADNAPYIKVVYTPGP